MSSWVSSTFYLPQAEVRIPQAHLHSIHRRPVPDQEAGSFYLHDLHSPQAVGIHNIRRVSEYDRGIEEAERGIWVQPIGGPIVNIPAAPGIEVPSWPLPQSQRPNPHRGPTFEEMGVGNGQDVESERRQKKREGRKERWSFPHGPGWRGVGAWAGIVAFLAIIATLVGLFTRR